MEGFGLSDKKTMKGMFRCKTKGIAEGKMKLYSEELHDLYSCPHRSVIEAMKSRSVKWTGIVAECDNRGMHSELYVKF